MSGIPLPALDIRPPQQQPDTTENFLRLKSLMGQQQLQQGQQQLQQQQIQSNQMDIDSQKAMTRAYTEAQGDPDKTIKLAAQYGAKPGPLLQLRNSFLDQQTKTIDLVSKQGAEAKRQADLMVGAHDQLAQAPSQDRAALYPQVLQSLGQQGVDVSKLPQQYPGDEALKTIGFAVKSHAQQVEDALKQSQAGKDDADAAAKRQETDFYKQNPSAGAPGVPVETVSMMDFMRKNPGATPSQYKAWQAKQEAVATAPEKIAVARAEGQARADVAAQVARGSNAALAQVPPHLVGPATAAAEKAGGEFAQAQSVTQRLNDMMDAAKKGNVISYQVIPEEGTLQITTSQGVHRINQAEIAQYAGGGSLWQRLQGHFGKALSGASIPSSVLSDMADIQKIQADGSKTKYNNTLKAINQNYGAKFEPVDMGDSTVRSTDPGAPAAKTGGYWDQFPVHK